MRERICITGQAGRLGRLLARSLGADYESVGLGRTAQPWAGFIQADLSRPGSIGEAFAGLDAVVHLAGYPFSDDNWDQIQPANVSGMVHLLEACRQADVRRFVFASSFAVVAGHLEEFLAFAERKGRLTRSDKLAFFAQRDPARADSLYGASKLFGEALCRMYSDRHDFSCVALRLAEVRPDDRPNPNDPHGHRKMCRHADFVAGVRRALERTRQPGFEIEALISDDFEP